MRALTANAERSRHHRTGPIDPRYRLTFKKVRKRARKGAHPGTSRWRCLTGVTASEGTAARPKHFRYMSTKELFDEPTEIEAVDGKVELDGPDGVDVAMTPEAAEEAA